MKKIKIWGHNVEYQYRDNADREINNNGIEHIVKLIKDGYSAASFYTIGPDNKKYHGWWTTNYKETGSYKIIKILGHKIKYWYNDHFGGEMDDNDIRKVTKLLAKKHKGGELYTNDHFGEWRKN